MASDSETSFDSLFDESVSESQPTSPTRDLED